SRPVAGGSEHQSGPEYFEGSESVESAGLASVARAYARAADRSYVPLRGADLHSGIRSAHAAVAESRAGDGQHADLREHLRRSAFAACRAYGTDLFDPRSPWHAGTAADTADYSNDAARQRSHPNHTGAGYRTRSTDRRNPPSSRALPRPRLARKMVRSRQRTGSGSGPRRPEKVNQFLYRVRHRCEVKIRREYRRRATISPPSRPRTRSGRPNFFVFFSNST